MVAVPWPVVTLSIYTPADKSLIEISASVAFTFWVLTTLPFKSAISTVFTIAFKVFEILTTELAGFGYTDKLEAKKLSLERFCSTLASKIMIIPAEDCCFLS